MNNVFIFCFIIKERSSKYLARNSNIQPMIIEILATLAILNYNTNHVYIELARSREHLKCTVLLRLDAPFF